MSEVTVGVNLKIRAGNYRLTLYLDPDDLTQHASLRDLNDNDLSAALKAILRGVRTVRAEKSPSRRAIEIWIVGQP